MKTIQTVCGNIEAKDVKGALVHEHVIASAAGIPENYPQLYTPGYRDKIIKALLELKEVGINTIVDAAPFDLGRDPKTLKDVAQETGMHIIATTGMFMDLNPNYGTPSEELIAQMYVDDLTKGMAGTDIKAGIIKAIMDRECDTPGRKIQHHAAAMASVETGACIYLHSASELETGRYQLALLLEAGADPKKIRIDHILDTSNMEYISWLYDQGVWLGVDRLPRIHFPHEHFNSTEERCRTIKKMIDAGMADRMLLSHDAGCSSTFWDNVGEANVRYVQEEVLPDGWLFIYKHAFPMMEKMGVDPEILHRILFENPAEYLGQ